MGEEPAQLKASHPLLQGRYRGRHLIENAFCRLEDFRRVTTRYDKLATNFLSGVAFATAFVLASNEAEP